MKTIVYVLMALAIMGLSVATTGYDVVVDCGTDAWWNPIGKQCEAKELQGTFNEVTSMIEKTDNYIYSKENAWSKDSKGASWFKVFNYINNEFFNSLKDLFVTKDDLALSEARIVTKNGLVGSVDCYAAMLRAEQTGKEYVIGNSLAYPGLKVCFAKE